MEGQDCQRYSKDLMSIFGYLFQTRAVSLERDRAHCELPLSTQDRDCNSYCRLGILLYRSYHIPFVYMASYFAQSRSVAPEQSSSSKNHISTRQLPPPKPAPVDLPALQNASRVLLEQLGKDAQTIPDLGETLTAGTFKARTSYAFISDRLVAAGTQASASYSIFPDDFRVPFQKRKFIGIPDALFQYYDSALQCS